MKKSLRYPTGKLFIPTIFLLLVLQTLPAFAWTAGQPLTIPYPRLGMWWPNTWEQSLDDIARYDYLLLFDDQGESINQIRARNSDIIILNSTNACELSYDWPDSADYAEIQKIPAQWFLTQVGSTLTQAVNTTTTSLRVADLTATDGTKLFVVGDTVLIDGESVLVQAIDENTKNLTVERGFVRPAAAHDGGTRLAAHITFWPGSWLLNLSTMSPPGVIDAAVGPEQWADYHARRDALLLTNPGWDGILIDRADPNQSWLIGSSTARTIDPDQSNTLLTDYSAFDAAWNAGLRRYEDTLRREIGENKILFVNWGMDNYDLLNGNNYEGFPMPDGTSYKSDWRRTVFGPVPQIGGYLEWMKQARQPNLTTIETYEDDGGPPPDDISYDNPCVKPGFVPNYQKMRFGLATALLEDGFYSYEINTNGHGSLCLLWFDEYDNAGKERGYLGQPLGPASHVALPDLGTNLLAGGDFETRTDLNKWELWADTGYAATLSRDTTESSTGSSSARITVTQAGGIDWQLSFFQQPLSLAAATDYTISFMAKADHVRPISIWAQQDRDPWKYYFEVGEITLGTTWKKYELSVTSNSSDPNAQFYFGLGQTTGVVSIDDVKVQSGSLEVWRRDYSKGIVLLNATSQSRQIELGGTFKKIKGTQAPLINDGSLVTKVTLQPHDGLILLRTGGVDPPPPSTTGSIAPILHLLTAEDQE